MSTIEFVLPLVMLATLIVVLFSGFPMAFVLAGVGLIFAVVGSMFDMFRAAQLFLIIGRIWGGIAENQVLVAIPMFIFMGVMLEKSGIAKHLLEILAVLLRRVPGGLAIAVVLMGTIMAATTGIVGASVVMLTMLALPVMMERGYSKAITAGTIAASGTLGVLIPPSVMLVIMGDLLSISVGDLFTGALLPGLLLSALYLTFLIVAAIFRPDLLPPATAIPFEGGVRELAILVFKGFVPPTILVMMVLGSIFFGVATPTEAAGVGAFGSIVLSFANGSFSLRLLREVAESAALTNAMIFGIFCGATLFSYVFRALGGDDAILHIIDMLNLHDWSLLILLMSLIFILGFFFDWMEITLIVLPIFAPVVASFDLGMHVPKGSLLLWFSVLTAVNLQTSYLTPPFGPALFYLRGAGAEHLTLGDIYRGVVPFTLLQLTGLGLCVAFPQIVLWLPEVLMR